MYNKLFDPLTEAKHSINSREAKYILKQYIKYLKNKKTKKRNNLFIKIASKNRIKNQKKQKIKCLNNREIDGYTWNSKKNECSKNYQTYSCKIENVSTRKCPIFLKQK